MQNSENLLSAIDSFQKELDLVKSLVEQRDEPKLKEWMLQANKLHKIL